MISSNFDGLGTCIPRSKRRDRRRQEQHWAPNALLTLKWRRHDQGKTARVRARASFGSGIRLLEERTAVSVLHVDGHRRVGRQAGRRMTMVGHLQALQDIERHLSRWRCRLLTRRLTETERRYQARAVSVSTRLRQRVLS